MALHTLGAAFYYVRRGAPGVTCTFVYAFVIATHWKAPIELYWFYVTCMWVSFSRFLMFPCTQTSPLIVPPTCSRPAEAFNRLLNFHVVRSTRPCQFTPACFIGKKEFRNQRDASHLRKAPDYPDPKASFSCAGVECRDASRAYCSVSMQT